MGFAWPIVYMRARRLYDSPRRPYQLKYFHGDSPAALCAPHAPPPIWIGTPEVTSTRGGYSMRFSMRHVYACTLWTDGYFPGKWESWKIGGDGTSGCLVEGGCRIWLVSRRNFIITRFTSVGRLGFWNCLKFLFVKCMCVGLKRCYSL